MKWLSSEDDGDEAREPNYHADSNSSIDSIFRHLQQSSIRSKVVAATVLVLLGLVGLGITGAIGQSPVGQRGLLAVHQQIPNVVHLVAPWKPQSLINESLKVLPDTTFKYYNYADMEASIASISKELEADGLPGLYDAFHALRPIAYRVDLWRIAVLWQQGGIYIDAKVKFLKPLSTWVDLNYDHFTLCRDISYKDLASNTWDGHHWQWETPELYWNGVLAAQARLPLLKIILSHLLKNVQDRSYSKGFFAALNMTGPAALTHALQSKEAMVLPPPRVGCHNMAKSMIIGDSGRQEVMKVSNTLREAMNDCRRCNNYFQLYTLHQVYCDEQGPTWPCEHFGHFA
eukprot:TRINITY_DN46167_c0_g1_i1.p1 TRINITY_DN46167_c0_g1~~TRINITY_DN46167_c0_g1_i1.p1  ORF type:complete len:344 (+),score=42.12 TRINITY_DN46167_c0_g1_i1:77-1108(+)